MSIQERFQTAASAFNTESICDFMAFVSINFCHVEKIDIILNHNTSKIIFNYSNNMFSFCIKIILPKFRICGYSLNLPKNLKKNP